MRASSQKWGPAIEGVGVRFTDLPDDIVSYVEPSRIG